ncbi:MAG: SDR family oxidoreductase [Myxococcales bacterium]|nr:MAG: SDR family oxidoreductase [Myxococcales bacterium]
MKRALVTGASSGIGKSFSEQLATQGYELTLVARNQHRLNELKNTLPGKGHRILVADLSNAAGIEKVCQELTGQSYDLLVNNAGLGVYGAFSDTAWDELEFMYRVNCDALLKLSHAFLKQSKRGDALINLASVLGFLPFPFGGALYGASKSFVVSLSQALWEEQRKRGVYVMALCPGSTATEFFDRAGGDPNKLPPKSITQSPGQVVKEALSALGKQKKPVVVTGAKNKLIVTLARFLSFRMQATLMRNAAPETSVRLRKSGATEAPSFALMPRRHDAGLSLDNSRNGNAGSRAKNKPNGSGLS